MTEECQNHFDQIADELREEIKENPEIEEAQALLSRIESMPEWAKNAGDAIIRGSEFITGTSLRGKCNSLSK